VVRPLGGWQLDDHPRPTLPPRRGAPRHAPAGGRRARWGVRGGRALRAVGAARKGPLRQVHGGGKRGGRSLSPFRRLLFNGSSATPFSTRALAFREPGTAHVSGRQRMARGRRVAPRRGERLGEGERQRTSIRIGRFAQRSAARVPEGEDRTRLVNRVTPPDHTLAAYCDRRGTGIPPLVAVSYSEARRFVGSDEVCRIGVINACWVRRSRLRLVRPCSGNQFTSVSSIRAFALCTLESLAERPSSGSPWP
jgi:hypothetical protein